MKKNYSLLFGKTENHLLFQDEFGHFIHRDVIEPLSQLKKAASQEGFDLKVASAFRSFDRQLSIWNKKISGQTPLLDSQGLPLDRSSLSEEEIVFSILRWSAIPGASRHHWGTDLDLYDGNSLPAHYKLQLIPQEVTNEGMFGPFHLWLDEQIRSNFSFGFYRPYEEDLGGVSPERWHLSYAPLAHQFLNQYTEEIFLKLLYESDMLAKDIILQHHERIYHDYFLNIAPLPWDLI